MTLGRKKFVTTDAKDVQSVWEYQSRKETGSVPGGPLTGFYTSLNKTALIKQDPAAENNISEFLAGKVYQKIIPHYSAKISLTRVDESKKISENGDNVYVVSHFIPNYHHDLYADVQEVRHRHTQRSSHGLIEGLQIFFQQLFHLKTAFTNATRAGHFSNFGIVSGANLIINHNDAHVANLIVLKKEGEKKELGVIDYGYAWRNMTAKINPHSFTKYLWTHARRIQGWNNFVFYPRAPKITPAFVAGLDKAASVDLADVIHEACAELSEYYGIKPLIQFMVKTNLLDEDDADLLLYYWQTSRYKKNFELSLLKKFEIKITESVNARRMDLLRFSAQIKMDLCLKENRDHHLFLAGYAADAKKENWISFEDVIFQHLDYFAEVLSGKETFKFRDPAHQKRALNALVKKEVTIALASLICVKYRNYSLDRVVLMIKTGELRGEELYLALKASDDQIAAAKDFLKNHKSRLMQKAKSGGVAQRCFSYSLFKWLKPARSEERTVLTPMPARFSLK